jgi:DNA-binding HxlR family transcriptional regulator
MSEKNYCPLNYTMSLIGTKWTLNFISFIGWSLRSGLLQKKISGISNKMFTHRKRIRKDGLISRKFFR